MDYYQRYASGEHDKEFFKEKRSNEHRIKEEKLDLFNVPPLAGQFGNFTPKETRFLNIGEWRRIFESGAIFTVYDDMLFGHIIILVHEDLYSKKISTKSLTRFGYTCYKNLILDEKSRFWPSCENLSSEYKNSNVRRALAITNLKNYNALSNNPGNLNITKHWDETIAGELASKMKLITEVSPSEMGDNLLKMGLLQPNYTRSVLVDVIYQNPSSSVHNNLFSDNDKIVFQLGEQLDHLFDPLLEYCPQEMESFYIPPEINNYTYPSLFNNESINNILMELIEVQKNFMLGLVGLLQDFIIPLRIHVLKLGSTSGISKINKVFPPTIDEITRINCILHGFLEKALKFGYIEIFKVMGMMMPYFYKAFIRHEANLKGFSLRLTKFFARNKKKVLSSKVVNKTSYTAKEIDSIVSGSLFELPRLKLILQRLYNTIEGEKVKLRNFEEMEDYEETIINTNFLISMDVIDAFGGSESTEDRSFDLNERIFTPTGKILTEIASSWPEELQYGWLNRKVVGIFELKNITPNDPNVNSEVLIIFSDHLMFISVYEPTYLPDKKQTKFDNSKTSLSISDILMHSLVNEKPLPKLSSLPYMEVNSWCDINEVVATSYRAPDSSLNEKEFLRFICTSSSGFENPKGTSNISIKNYEIIDSKNSYSESGKVLELIDKSRILRKSEPFHLFKSIDEGLNIYSTAQTITHYESEISKSPIALFLNFSLENPESYFSVYSNLLNIIIITVLNDHQFEIEVYDKLRETKIKEVVLYNNLISFLEEIISTFYFAISTTTNFISDKLMESYEYKIANYLQNILPGVASSPLVSKEASQFQAEINALNTNFNDNISKPEIKTVEKIQNTNNNTHKESKVSKKQKVSFIRRIFKPFIKTSKQHVRFEDNESVKTASYSNKGEEREFVHLYSPAPKLLKESDNKLIDNQNNNKAITNNELVDNSAYNDYEIHNNLEMLDHSNKHKILKSKSLHNSTNDANKDANKGLVISDVNDTSLPYSNPSLDVNSHFIFPENSEESIVKEVTENPSGQQLTKGKLITENSIKLEKRVSIEDINNIKEVKGDDNISVHSYNISSLSYELFYKDGESNWVSLTRDNSFLLHEEIEVLKEDANMDTEDVIIVNENDSVHMKNLFNNLDGNISQDNFYTPYSDPIEQFMNEKFVLSLSSSSQAPNQLNTSLSLQSLTSSQMINEFSNAINFDTSMDEELNTRFSIYSTDASTSNYVNVKSASYITVNTNSSEDEFYSPEEYEQVSRFTQRLPSSNSFSSEATIINEKLTDNVAILKKNSDKP